MARRANLNHFERNTMQITVTIREVYGIKTVYPVCITAKVFASIAGTKTLTLATLKKIEALGYSIMQQTEPLAL
jgi:hypothetical protein